MVATGSVVGRKIGSPIEITNPSKDLEQEDETDNDGTGNGTQESSMPDSTRSSPGPQIPGTSSKCNYLSFRAL